MRLEHGQNAPDFGFDDLDGKPLRLSSFRDQVVWLSFQRDVDCPLSRLRTYELTRSWWRELAGKIRILTVFPSSAARLREVPEVAESPLTVVADPDGWIERLYGIETALLGFLDPCVREEWQRARSLGFTTRPPPSAIPKQPADFMIDPTGVIRLARYAAHWSDHLTVEDVVRFLNPLGLEQFEVGPIEAVRGGPT